MVYLYELKGMEDHTCIHQYTAGAVMYFQYESKRVPGNVSKPKRNRCCLDCFGRCCICHPHDLRLLTTRSPGGNCNSRLLSCESFPPTLPRALPPYERLPLRLESSFSEEFPLLHSRSASSSLSTIEMRSNSPRRCSTERGASP